MDIIAHIKHWGRKLIHRPTWTNWMPGETPPPPMTKEMMDNAYRKMVDAGVVKYGEPVFIETYNWRTKTEDEDD
jgi:hypothetical protein